MELNVNENVLPSIFLGLTCLVIGIRAFLKKNPVRFYGAIEVGVEEIKAVRAYNKENGFMWCIHGGVYILYGISLLSKELYDFLQSHFNYLFIAYYDEYFLLFLVLGSLLLLFASYRNIYKKYGKPENKRRMYNQDL